MAVNDQIAQKIVKTNKTLPVDFDELNIHEKFVLLDSISSPVIISEAIKLTGKSSRNYEYVLKNRNSAGKEFSDSKIQEYFECLKKAFINDAENNLNVSEKLQSYDK